MSATIKLPKITKIPEKGRTLAFACYSGNVQLAEEILENDPGMVLEEDPSSGATPLHYSLARSSLRTAQLLVEQPLLDEYKKYKDKLTELAKRAQNMGKSMVSDEDLRLCEQWLNEERSRYSSEFQIQCYRATFDLLTMPDNKNMTPLHYGAASRDNTLSNLIEYCIKFSKSQTMFQGSSNNNKAFGAGSGGNDGEESVTQRLQRAEASHVKRGMKRIALKQVNVQDTLGNTPLHYAAASGSNGALRFLLNLGADKKVTNKNAQSPAEIATDQFCRMALMQMPEAADVAIDNLSTLNLERTAKKKKKKKNKDDDDDDDEEDEKIRTRNNRLKSKATHAIQALIDCGNDVNEVTSIQANTALHRAATRAQIDVTQELLKAGADVTKTNCNGWTPLHYCAYFSTRDHCDVASILLSADADVNARTMRKRTALHMAVLQQHVDTSTKEHTIKRNANKTKKNDKRHSNDDEEKTDDFLQNDSSKWLRKGWGSYDENTRTSNRSPKRKIRQSKFVSTSVVNMINILIQNGVDLEARDDDGMTALHHAAEYGNPRTVFTLIEAGVDMYAVCKRKFNALHYASAHDKNEVVRLLVKLDCEDRKLKNMRNCSGQTPFDVAMSKKTRASMMNLWEACEEGQLERVRVYLNNVASIGKGEVTGADALNALKPWMPVTVTEKTRKNKRSCLHLVARGASKVRWEIMKKLKEAKKTDRGLNVSKYQKALKTKLRNFKMLMQLLIAKGANVDQKDNFGATPLMYASQGGICSLMETLIRDGKANLEKTDKFNNNALHYAIAFNQIAAANLLEDCGADALALNDIDETPTDVAGIRKKLMNSERYDIMKNDTRNRRNYDDSSENDYTTTTDNDYTSNTDNNYGSSTSTDSRKSRRPHPRHKSKLKQFAEEVDREDSAEKRKKKKNVLKDAADEVNNNNDDADSNRKPRRPPVKKKASLKDIAADISDDDDDDYGDDDFEGTGSSNTNVTAKKPNKPNRPSGAGRGGRPTSSASSSSSRGGRPGGRPSGRPSGRPGGARPTRGGRS